jgi:hypothetical protein
MNRRDLLQATVPAAAAATLGVAHSAIAQTSNGDEHGNGRELYEWRTYRFEEEASHLPGGYRVYAAKHAKLNSYLKDALLPAAKRLGLGPVGVFTEIGPDATPAIHVLLVYPNASAYVSARDAIEADAAYQRAAADYLASKVDNPAFEQIDSHLLLAFKNAPKITPPAKQPRVLEVRTYKNHGEDRARAKIDMFNDGEIAIFPKCGFENVWFGEVLAGDGQPALKYMLAAPDMAANEAGWKKFLAHPDFIRMRDDPKYADTMPKITKLFLEPTDYSQV